MTRILLVAGLAGLVAGPALAAAHLDLGTLTCADYLAMEAEAQAEAATALGEAAEEMGHGLVGEGEEALMGEELTAHVTEMCAKEGMAGMVATEAMMADE